MSFWKNPEYKALRMVIVLVVLVAIAYFAVSAKKSNSLDQSGKVININQVAEPSKLPQCNLDVAFYPGQDDGCDVQMPNCSVSLGYPASNSSGEDCCFVASSATSGTCYTASGIATPMDIREANKTSGAKK